MVEYNPFMDDVLYGDPYPTMMADVLYGIDNTFLSRALDAGIFDSYSAQALASVPDALEAGTNGVVTPHAAFLGLRHDKRPRDVWREGWSGGSSA